MKNFNKTTLLLVVSIVMTLISCNKKNDNPEIDGMAPLNVYAIQVKFEDKAGRDLVRSLTGTSSSIMKINCTTQSDKKYPLRLRPVEIGRNESGDYLLLDAYSYHGPSFCYKQTSYKLSCPHIFGDDNEHTITMTWNNIDGHICECIRIEVDGKEFPVSQNTEREFPTAAVVIDNVIPN